MIRSLVELPPLEDIIETITYVDPNETQDRNDIIETLQLFIHEILEKNPRMYEKYDFDDELYDSVYDTFSCSFLNEMDVFSKFDLSDLISEAMDMYFCLHKPRSYPNTFYPLNADYKELERNIKKNMKKEQPEQKTKEWYESVNNGITYNGSPLNFSFVSGGTFSLDGINLTGRGNALLCNEFIKAINKKYNAQIPRANALEYDAVLFPQ